MHYVYIYDAVSIQENKYLTLKQLPTRIWVNKRYLNKPTSLGACHCFQLVQSVNRPNFST